MTVPVVFFIRNNNNPTCDKGQRCGDYRVSSSHVFDARSSDNATDECIQWHERPDPHTLEQSIISINLEYFFGNLAKKSRSNEIVLSKPSLLGFVRSSRISLFVSTCAVELFIQLCKETSQRKTAKGQGRLCTVQGASRWCWFVKILLSAAYHRITS